VTTSILDLTPTSPRKHRIAAVREMARKVRNFCDSLGIHRFAELETHIKRQERHHRSGYPGGYAESVAVAADYFIVQCFERAFEVLEDNEGKVPAMNLDVRTDYLLALSIVAGNSKHNAILGALSNLGEERRFIESRVHLGELKHAATLLDYSADIARG
jgi:hypothetical protein